MSVTGDLLQGLMARIERGGRNAEDAAIILGLLIERERVHRPLGDDGGIEQAFGPEIASRRLSPHEVEQAVAFLMTYVRRTAEPPVSAIWALGKSADPATVPVLVEVFNQTFRNVGSTDVACQALQALFVNGLDSAFAPMAAAAVERAAIEGQGEVKRVATECLRAMGPKYEDNSTSGSADR